MTAVESIIDKINNVKPTQFCSIETIKDWCEQAKEMERNQIIRAINYSEMKHDELLKQAIEKVKTIGEIYYEKIFI